MTNLPTNPAPDGLTIEKVEKLAVGWNRPRCSIEYEVAKQLATTMKDNERIREKGNRDALEAAGLKEDNERLRAAANEVFEFQVSSSKLQMTTPSLLTGTYLFHAKMDLGSVQNVRLTAYVQAAVFNASDLIDSRGLIDTWASVDGTSSAAADFQVYVRSTQTDPAGSPTWTAWNLLHSGEFSARGFDFKGIFTTTDPTYNIAVSQLNIKAATA